MSKWYSIKALADGKSVDVEIYDEIGFWGVTARDFVAELNDKAKDATQINLHLNSPGGEVYDGIAIQNVLKNHPAQVTAYIDGLAGSMATIVALAGDTIEIADNAYVMIHNPSWIVFGEADDMTKGAELLTKMAEGMASEYAAKMGITTAEARELMNAETWYRGQEAVDAGYADKTYSGREMVAHFDAKRFSDKAPAEAVKRFTQPPRGKTQQSTKETPVKDDEQTTEDETTVETDETTTESETNTETGEDSGGAEARVQKAVDEALANDRKRVAEITALGNKFGFAKDAEQHIAEGKSLADFRAHVLEKSPDDWKASLKVQNPAHQDSEDDLEDDSEETKEATARIKERRRARMGLK